MELPVVTIQGENGPLIINLSDFDPAIHKLLGDEAAPVEAPVAEAAPVEAPVAGEDE